jgi:hypothetical protein
MLKIAIVFALADLVLWTALNMPVFAVLTAVSGQ